ncbi:MAG: hypothetical protein ACI9N9_000074 [Enterobacterales bacterium]|jgi:hypothetical protein
MYNDQLLQEMKSFGNKNKAEIVHAKCLKAKKFNLASKIARKYKIEQKHDDMITSFVYALKI